MDECIDLSFDRMLALAGAIASSKLPPQNGSTHALHSHAKRLLDFVEGANLLKIGCGDDALVYELPNKDRAVRIATQSHSFRHFIEAVQANPNPHFPQIISYGEKNGCSVTIMERLQPAPDNAAFWREANGAIALAYARLDNRPGVSIPSKSSLGAAAIFLGETARMNDYALDLNRGNILKRLTDGEAVFTDPWCTWGE